MVVEFKTESRFDHHFHLKRDGDKHPGFRKEERKKEMLLISCSWLIMARNSKPMQNKPILV